MNPGEYRSKAAERACVNIYSVGGGGPSYRYYWPYKLEHARSASKKTKKTCDVYMMDSGVSNPDITNEEVLDAAEKYGADYVIPKDYLHDQESTTKSVYDFLEVYESHPCEADYIIPLQPPHDKHHRELSGFDAYAIGGMAKLAASEQLNYIRRLREAVGEGVHLHALGMGASREIVDTLRNNPELLDSMDTSTPENAPKNGEIPDSTFIQNRQKFNLPGGDGASTGKAIAAELILWQMAQMLNPEWGGREKFEQTGIGSYV